MSDAFQYTVEHKLYASDDYPYTAKDDKCRAEDEKGAFQIKKYKEVDENSVDALKAAIAQVPTSVAIQADSFVFQFYSGGVLDSKSCGTDLNHGVLAVGYGK